MTYFQLYHQAQLRAWSGQVNWGSDVITMTLHTSSYVPNLDTDAYVSDLHGEVVTGLGYTTGGLVLGAKGGQYIPAGTWGNIWAPLTAYQVGQMVRPITPAGLVYRCSAAGTSGAAPPAFAGAGLTTQDGTVTWLAAGPGAVCLTAAPPTWPGFSASFRYAVLSDRSAGALNQQPLLAIADFGATVSGAGGNFTPVFDQMGALALWPA